MFEPLYAQGRAVSTATEPLIQKIIVNILNPLVGLLFAVALLYFLWGVFQYVRNAESDEKRSEGGRTIMWGLVGMLIMVSAYGFIRLILNSFSIPFT